jgi:aspartate/methionine/tyrosine aminotransferase
MKLNDFKLECYFGKHEFTAPFLLTQSDCEAMTINELLAMEPGAKEEFLNMWLGYTQTWGDPILRASISDLYENMTSDNVLVMHGASEGIFAAMNVLLEEGDHLIALYPNYQSLYDLTSSIPNCELSKWELKDDGKKWTVDFEELKRLIKPNTKMISLASPNNPTGYTFTNSELKQLAKIAEENDLYIFCDEVYRGLELDGEKRKGMAEFTSKAISLGVLSKSFGLPGLRVGWVVSRDLEVLEKIVKFKHYMSICDSAPSEFLAKVALKHKNKILSRNKQIVEKNLQLAREFFARYPKLFAERKATGGPIAFNKLLIDKSVTEFCEEAINKKGVLLMPDSIYDFKGNYFRMGYGRANFAQALAKFEEFLQENGYV